MFVKQEQVPTERITGNRGRGVARLPGCLPSVQEAMSSIPNTIDTLDGGASLGSPHYTLGLYLLNGVIFMCVRVILLLAVVWTRS